MVIGGSPIITLQIIMMVNPLTVYTVDPTLTVMTPFSTEGGADSLVSMTMAITNSYKSGKVTHIPIYLPIIICNEPGVDPGRGTKIDCYN